MNFSYNWLQSFFNKKLPNPAKLAEILTLRAFEVKDVQKSGKDWILDIDVLPNRGPDCSSHFGMAREISAILANKLDPLLTEKLQTIKNQTRPINIKIQPKTLKLVPRYSAILIEDIKIQPSPQWLKEKLEAVGLRAINNIVDLTNYVMLEMGQPLHAFDYDKIWDQKIVLRQSRRGEKLITLDDREHDLEKDMLVIEDKKRLIDLAGIMGGKLAEIDSKTKNVLLQAANFDRKTIYQTAKKLDQHTLASKIYSQGLDPNLTIQSLERFNFLLQHLGGGKIVQIIDIYHKKFLPKKIIIELNYIQGLLGLVISRKDISKILKNLDFKIKFTSSKFQVEVPTIRLDISSAEDIIEEIGRIYGYENIPSRFPITVLIPPRKSLDIFWENLTKNILKEAGFTEVYNYSFISQREKDIFNLENPTEIKNPTSADYQYLRPTLIPNLLNNIKKNQAIFDKIKIFELGKIFQDQKEKRMLTGVMTGDAFFEAKGVIDLLLEKLGISGVWYDEYKPTPEESKISVWKAKKCAEIKINQEELGFMGEISPKISEDFKINGKVVVFDINFEKLQKISSEEHEYRPISQYPAAIRDIAILMPRDVFVEEVLNEIEKVGAGLIRDIDLFDIYEGPELPEGKKNLAFHIIYQAQDRTLSSKEIDEIQERIVKTLEKKEGWQVRK